MDKTSSVFDKFGVWLSALFGLIIFHSKIGLAQVLPGNYKWLLTRHSDWTPDFVAWMYYRNDEWRFPLGLFEGYSYPETVSIALTGGIPLLAIPFKLLDPILPDIFQYHGLWVLLCFVLQGVFAYKLLSVLKVENSIVRVFGACLFVLSYSLLDRIGHLNLMAHWLILAGLWNYFASFSWRKTIIIHMLLVSASVMIHPYLIVFTIMIAAATYLNRWSKDWKKNISPTLIAGTLTLAATAGTWMLMGNHVLDLKSATAEGFRLFSANLNTFWTPKIDTPLMPALAKAQPEQFEGTAYLGLGILAFVFFIPVFFLTGKIKLQWKKDYVVIGLLALAFAALAVTNRVTFNHRILFEIPISEYLINKLSIVRASGRYIWLLQYLLISGFVLLIGNMKINSLWKYLFLALAVLVNIVDFYDVVKRNEYIVTHYPPIPDFDQAIWDGIFQGGHHVRMYPSHETAYQHKADQMGFAFTAGKFDKPINTGHLARYNFEKRRAYHLNLQDSLLHHPNGLSQYTFITNEEGLPDFIQLEKLRNHQLVLQDGYYVFLPESHPLGKRSASLLQNKTLDSIPVAQRESFGEFVNRYQDQILLMAVKDDANNHLSNCSQLMEFLKEEDAKLMDLAFRESYVGIFDGRNGRMEILGRSREGKAVQIDTFLNFSMEGKNLEKRIEIYSADMDNGNKARIFVRDRDYAKNERGLNIVVLDHSGEVVESTRFDTYQSCHHFTDKSALYYDLWRKE